MVWTDIISFSIGVVMRMWNEERKAKAEEQKLHIAAMTKRQDILNLQVQNVASHTFMQTMMMVLVFAALGVLVMFPLIAVFADVPLFILHTYIKETGILFWKSSQEVYEWSQVNGLYLPEEIRMVILEAIKFIFGATVGGLGRR